jgi:integrase
MSKRVAPLTAKQIERWPPDPARTLELVDGAVSGLRVRLTPSGSISWSLNVRLNGKRRRIALGEAVSLSEARRAGQEARQQIAAGKDPAANRRAARARQKAAELGLGTLGSVIAAYYEWGPGSERKSGKAARALIEAIFQTQLARPALDITSSELQLLVDGWRSKSSGRHCAAYFRPLARWAGKRGLMAKGDALEGPSLARRPLQRALSCHEVALLLRILKWRAHDLAARFMLVTGARREEVCGAMWTEMDLQTRTWTIPGTRRKDTRPSAGGATPDHVVPLPRQALDILRELGAGGSDNLVFVGKLGASLTNWPRWSARMKKRAGFDVSPHALRRTCATLAGDLGQPPHVVSALLGHRSIGGALHSGYNQSRYRAEVAIALQRVADMLDGLAAGGDRPISIGRRA